MTDANPLHARAEQLVRKWQRDDPKGCMPSQLIAAIEAVLREQIEECARVADAEKAWCEMNMEVNDTLAGQVGASSRIAAAIRRLNEQG